MEVIESVDLVTIAENVSMNDAPDTGFNLLRGVIREKKQLENIHATEVKEKYAEHKAAKKKQTESIKFHVEAEEILRSKVNDWLTLEGERAEAAAMEGNIINSLVPPGCEWASADGFYHPEIVDMKSFLMWCIDNDRLDLVSVSKSGVNGVVSDGFTRPNGVNVTRKYRVKVGK